MQEMENNLDDISKAAIVHQDIPKDTVPIQQLDQTFAIHRSVTDKETSSNNAARRVLSTDTSVSSTPCTFTVKGSSEKKNVDRQQPRPFVEAFAPGYTDESLRSLIQTFLDRQDPVQSIDDVVLEYLERATEEFLEDCDEGQKQFVSPEDRAELVDLFIGCVPGLVLDVKHFDAFLDAALCIHARCYKQ